MPCGGKNRPRCYGDWVVHIGSMEWVRGCWPAVTTDDVGDGQRKYAKSGQFGWRRSHDFLYIPPQSPVVVRRSTTGDR